MKINHAVAAIAQVVERHIGNVEVTSSSLVSSFFILLQYSKKRIPMMVYAFSFSVDFFTCKLNSFKDTNT